MSHLNYCRQMVKQFGDFLQVPSHSPENKKALSHAIDLARASQKFLLPVGGRLHDDPEYRALDETQPLRLPYPFIALEYHRPRPTVFTGDFWSSKAIVFARERDDVIVMTPIVWVDANGTWGVLPELALPMTGYLDRAAPRHVGIDYWGKKYQSITIKAHKSDERIPSEDYYQEVGALLCFLNVLQCGNVSIEKSFNRARPANLKKTALPFDDYHILTIEAPGMAQAGGDPVGHGRSPREHLRRGHIRRYESGLKIWVNAAVVNAGVGGKVTKDYRIASRSVAQGIQ